MPSVADLSVAGLGAGTPEIQVCGTNAAGDLLPQLAAGTRKAGSDRADGHARLLGRLIIGHAFDGALMDDPSLIVLQTLERLLGFAQFHLMDLGSVEGNLGSIGFKLHLDDALPALALIEEKIAEDRR
jgi:hypothetical protein